MSTSFLFTLRPNMATRRRRTHLSGHWNIIVIVGIGGGWMQSVKHSDRTASICAHTHTLTRTQRQRTRDRVAYNRLLARARHCQPRVRATRGTPPPRRCVRVEYSNNGFYQVQGHCERSAGSRSGPQGRIKIKRSHRSCLKKKKKKHKQKRYYRIKIFFFLLGFDTYMRSHRPLLFSSKIEIPFSSKVHFPQKIKTKINKLNIMSLVFLYFSPTDK